ncbi:RES family NAD+ phosphorylase [Rhodococcus rhodochrous]|uniref:RES family NAD+ phosphorylase n=1 Tax=Rhodococcus rhodochrous TaxID=1829 RepID=A0AAW4XKW3_RHORH|nr:RES family NAD+ phosphorylase [Rhodococcus rhodochrous]MCD2114338.1 RES family NAD+ phosphorylase [Rhodococcus rhodochrous]
MSEHPTSDHTEVPLQRPEDDEFYNGSAVEVMTVPAGTTLWRFVELDPPYDVSTFNPNISPHHEHPTGAELGQQGRFDPLDRAHGGYVYCSPTLGGAVAEGILRAKKVPASRIIPAVQVDGRALVRWQLHVDLDVAALRDPHLRKIGLTSSIHSCTRRDYGWSRRVAHAILSRNPHLHGLAYPCRNDTHSTALLLVQRPQGPLTGPGAYSFVDMRAPVRDASLRYDIARTLFISAGVVLGEPNPEGEE